MDLDLQSLFKQVDDAPQKREYTVIPTGQYDVTVHFAQVDLAKTVPRVVINYKILDQPEEFKGRILFSSFQLNETGSLLLKKSLRKLGVDVTSIKTLDNLNDSLGSILGMECLVFAKAREYTKNDGTTGHAHNVYVNSSTYDLDNLDISKPANDALLKASDGNVAGDDFSFD